MDARLAARAATAPALAIAFALAGCVGDDLAIPDPGPGTSRAALSLLVLNGASAIERTVAWEVADPDGVVAAHATWTIAPGAHRDAHVPMPERGVYRVVVSDDDLGGKMESRVTTAECAGTIRIEIFVPESGEPFESDRACA